MGCGVAAAGRWRLKHGQTRLYGCTQWHMWHWTLVWEFATNPLVHGLLFSLKVGRQGHG